MTGFRLTHGSKLKRSDVTRFTEMSAEPVAEQFAVAQTRLPDVGSQGFADPGMLTVADVLTLQRTVGNRAVQRLIDRTSMVAKAGAPKSGLRKSSEYRAVLAQLDRYHQQLDLLWKRPANATDFKDDLNDVLDDLHARCQQYLQANKKASRRPFILDLTTVDIPAERQRIDDLTSSGDFNVYDRSQPPGALALGSATAPTSAHPARVTSTGIQVQEDTTPDPDEGGIAKGHSMAVWAELDAGAKPAPPPQAPPDSIYGVSLEYWENVDVAYNFIAAATDTALDIATKKANGLGGVSKPWNDIMAMQPDSPTWTKTGAPIAKSWPEAVKDAKAGTLSGPLKVGFRDIPGVTPKPGKHIKRILRFRVVIKDGAKQQEIYATQVIECDGGDEPVYKLYSDSRGTQLAVERTAGATGPQLTPMAANDPRRQPHDVTPALLVGSIPNAARGQISTFVQALLAGTAAAFKNSELDQIKAKIGDSQGASGPYKQFTRVGPRKQGPAGPVAGQDLKDEYYMIAGMNMVPFPKPGWEYKQLSLGANGLLVAIMQGSTILKMYYTTNNPATFGAQNWQVRSFAEVPIEEVTPYVKAQQYQTSLGSTAERNEFARAGAAKAAKAQVVAQAPQNIDPHITTDNAALVYLQAHIGDYALIEARFDALNGAIATPKRLADVLKAHFDAEVAANGATHTEYQRLFMLYPDNRAREILRRSFVAKIRADKGLNEPMALNEFYKLINDNRKDVQHAPALIAIVQTNSGNAAALATALMQHLRANKGAEETIESDYNAEIPKLGIAAAPATFGEAVHQFFVRELGARGKGTDVFRELMEDYPGFGYRLEAAYRYVFGDAQLKTALGRMRTAALAAEVPDPGDPANLRAKYAFRQHALYTRTNFTPSTGAGKFDAEYNPSTGQLKITVKVFFEFMDSKAGTQPVQGNEAGAQFQQTAWTTQGKDDFKNNFKQNVIEGIWNKNRRTIHCVRPGWEDITAEPTIEVVEVAQGAEHHHVKAGKSTLAANTPSPNNPSKKKLMSPATSGYSAQSTGLHESDVLDKLRDPLVHRVLHQAEKAQNISTAYRDDRKRIVATLKQFGALTFPAGKGDLQDESRLSVLIGEIKRLSDYSALAHVHAIRVVGNVAAGGNKALRAQRAGYIAQKLKNAGIQNPIKVEAGTQSLDGVMVTEGPEDPKLVDTYVGKWSRVSAAHEFGHMIGLIDEYYQAASNETVKKMIADGLLPPDTKGDHFTRDQLAAATERAGQEATMKLLEANDLMTPDFRIDYSGPNEMPKSTSLMTGGFEVTGQHFVTVWEVLADMTKAEIDSKFWKIM